MPTDTLYGVVGRADNPDTVGRIYQMRKRNPEKPCIILIGDLEQIWNFSISLSQKQKEVLKKFWPLDSARGKPEPVSVVLDCPDDRLLYLHRGTNTLAFRLPLPLGLCELLKKTGPLVAPSANTEGDSSAQTIAEAKNYFSDQVDLYVDAGTLAGKPSKIVRLYSNGSTDIIRE
jgi:L-threonylcarbamoyladenylate synthase